MQEGWFKMQRSWLQNGVICADNDHLSVWVTLLANAVFEPMETVFNGQPVTLCKGELITGREILAEKTRVNVSKVSRILTRFQRAGLIEQTCKKGGRLIRLTPPEAEVLFGDRTDNEQITNTYRTDNEQIMDTIKERKKTKNERRPHYAGAREKRFPYNLSIYSSDASYDIEDFTKYAVGMRDDVEYEI